MVHAKNYEPMSTLIEVMQKKLWPLFFRTWCITRTRICSVECGICPIAAACTLLLRR